MPAKSADEAIRRAMEEGKFDNLPGKGKPLKLDENPHEDPEWRMAHQVLKNSGFTLPWIQARQEIEAELATARDALARTAQWRAQALAAGGAVEFVESEWQRASALFRLKAAAINKRIFSYNLEAPAAQVQIAQVDVEGEIGEAVKRVKKNKPASQEFFG